LPNTIFKNSRILFRFCEKKIPIKPGFHFFDETIAGKSIKKAFFLRARRRKKAVKFCEN